MKRRLHIEPFTGVKFMKKLKLLIVTLQAFLLLGCGGGSGQSSSGGGSSTVYKVTYSDGLNVSESASEEFSILVAAANAESSLTSVSSSKAVTYSIDIVPNANIVVTNNCQNIALGTSCELMTSLTKQAADVEKLKFVVKLSNGVSKSESASLKKHRLKINLNSQEVLPVNVINTVSITNTSNVTAYFDKNVHFTDAENKEITSVSTTDSTCSNSLKPGDTCSLKIAGKKNGVTGQLKLDLHRDSLADISFSDVVVKAIKTEDVPANTLKGSTYPFEYTFTNTNARRPATKVSFTDSDSVSVDYFYLDPDSSCDYVEWSHFFPANSSCTWKGNFKPISSDGRRSMTITLHYAEGGDVALTSSSQVTDVVVTGIKTRDIPANTVKRVSYPFTYTFRNTSTTSPATGISFTNSLSSSADFTIDTTQSTCNNVKSIPANGSCTWTGEFMPLSGGSKSMMITLHYAQGSDVTLTSTSQVPAVAVTGAKTQDIPEKAIKGQSYSFVYTFTNIDRALSATGVSFTNSLPADFTIDTADSTCNGVTSIAAQHNCTWTGTFTPESNGNKRVSLTLHYNQGSDVTISSASLALLATTPINTGPGAAEDSWSWPATRFEPAKKKDKSAACNDAEYDKLTGLMWAKDGSAAGKKKVNDALTYANNLTLCGYNDWRLPTVNELLSLINYADTTSPAHWLNANGFSDIKSDCYWTSNVGALTRSSWWYVGLSLGDILAAQTDVVCYMLPVREST